MSIRRIVLSALLIALVGCSDDDDPKNPTTDAPDAGASTKDDAATRPASVIRFGATPDAVKTGREVTLSWAVADAPDGITIEAMAMGLGPATRPATRPGRAPMTSTVAASMDAMGTVTVFPQTTTRYTLTARSAHGDATEVAEVTVEVAVPEIAVFTAEPTMIAQYATATVAWSVVGAESITIRRLHPSPHELLDYAPATGTVLSAVDVDATFEIEAWNAAGPAKRTVDVNTVSAPVIQSFTVTPPAFTGAEATVEVSWDVLNVSMVSFEIDGAPFPQAATAQGMVMIQATGATVLTLLASNLGGSVQAERTVDRAATEVEPNGSAASATRVGRATLGRLERASDDWFEVDVPQDGLLEAQVYSSGSCGSARMFLLENGTWLKTASAGSSPCLRLRANNLAAGTYHLRLFNSSGGGPDYTLITRVTPAACGNGILSTGEACDDGNNVDGDGCDRSCGLERRADSLTGRSRVPLTIGAGEIRTVTLATTEISQAITASVTDDAGRCAPLSRIRTPLAPTVTADDPGECAAFSVAYDVRDPRAPGTFDVTVQNLALVERRLWLGAHVITPRCGNGYRERGEYCDDGNSVDGDGCNQACEPANTLTIPLDDVVELYDREGADEVYRVVAPFPTIVGVEVDDGCFGDASFRLVLHDGPDRIATEAHNACPKVHQQLDAGAHFFRVWPDQSGRYEISAWYNPTCGNSVVEPPETCDDGNTDVGDGCDDRCRSE